MRCEKEQGNQFTMCLLTEWEKYGTGRYYNVREEGDKVWR